ncbi:MAG: hypothetical protein ACYTEL_17365 [Planctomycetota bacterium]|jgi:flagellar biosynthesis chaperone FliJ
MKRFVWRLQQVLEVKSREEEMRRAELLAVTERLAQTRSQLLARQRILEQIIREIACQEPQRRLAEQALFLKCSPTSDEQVKRLKARVGELESELREKMAQVLKLRRFKEGLEKLRAEAKRQFIAEQEKLEQKELDEMAGVSFVRERSVVLERY